MFPLVPEVPKPTPAGFEVAVYVTGQPVSATGLQETVMVAGDGLEANCPTTWFGVTAFARLMVA